MATGVLAQSDSAVLPLDYSFIYPALGAAWAMDRFIPSSRQPQHWSRNYHGSQEGRRSIPRRRISPDPKEKDASSYRQGVTLRAEDLLAESESKLGTGSRIPLSNHLVPRPGDPRRGVMGGSATELARGPREPQQPVLRRSSEGGGGTYVPRRRKSSSSSSNAADDPTSSDPSSSSSDTTTSSSPSSSSSESGCNADSETCNYCRLSESSEERESSTDEDNTPSSPSNRHLNNGHCRRLTRALSEDCHPPSNRPVRRTSPGEYLRHKRDQMERLRCEQQAAGKPRRCPVQRCDSDPRLGSMSRIESCLGSPPRTFASPTRILHRADSVDRVPFAKVILPVPNTIARTGATPGQPTPDASDRPRRSALAKNVSERRSRSQDRRRSSAVVLWSDESTPFLQQQQARRGSSFRCAVCDCDLPFTNCVLCSAEAKEGAAQSEEEDEGLGVTSAEVFVRDSDVISLSLSQSEEHFLVEIAEGVVPGEESGPAPCDQGKELEDFYDHPTPVELPCLPSAVYPSPDEKRIQWTSRGSVAHKSFNQGDEYYGPPDRRSSFRKYNSEPVPETGEFQYCSGENSDGQEHQRAESNASSKSETKAAYHVAKDNALQENKSSCHYCGKTAEDGEEEKSPKAPQGVSNSPFSSPEREEVDPQRNKSPTYLRPEFVFEPEIIHKANPLVDEADVDVLPSAAGVFRRLSEEEFISTLNIHEAAKKGDLHVVKLLTKKDPKQMETVDERGWTPIHLAAAHGHTEVVKYLAMEGAHLAALDPSSYTALHLAAMNGHNSCLEVLLPMGVDVDSVTSEGFTALHLAVMNNHLDCVQTLLQWGSSLEKRDALGRSIHDMIEEYGLRDVASLLRRFHKQLHNFKHVLDMMNKEGKDPSDLPREYMDILASIAEESGTD